MNRHTGRLQAQDVRGRTVAVSSGHALASAEAVRVFHDGGNVIDAAIAGAAVLAVVLPYACGIGGDLYLLFHEARTNRVHGLNGTGAAPSGATLSRFPNGLPQVGIRAATVPGTVAAWEDALGRFGTRHLRELLQPAIRLAENGFPAHEGLIENAREKEDLLRRDPEAARLFLPDGRHFAPGQLVVQRDLARALARIADHGAREFYEGALAHEFVEKIQRLGGDFAADDLARHRSLWQEAIGVPFYGHDVLTMPPNSVGAVLMLQLLALEAAGVGAMDPDSLAFWELTIRTWRWAKSVSTEAIGDPRDAVDRAIDLISRTRSAPSVARQQPMVSPRSGDTSNLVVMDSEGNAVSLVQSVSAPFASGVVVPGTGILLNNRMRGFNSAAGSVNCVAAGRRPAHTLVPALVTRKGSVVAAIGTPGAAGQTLTLAQVLSRALACRHDMAAAIEAPRWSVAPAGNLIVERTASHEVINGLSRKEPGLALEDVRHVRFGSVKAVLREPRALRAIADYRRVAAACAS